MTEVEFNDVHQRVSAMLPWYVNQTLDPEEDREVEAHLNHCLVCRQEVALQRNVQQAVASADVGEESLSRSMQTLHQRISQEQQRRQPRKSPWWQGLQHFVAMLKQSPMGIQGALLAQTAALVIALGFIGFGGTPQVMHYETLSSSGVSTITADGASPLYNVIFAQDLTVTEMQRVLNEEALQIHAGPSPAGAFLLAEAAVNAHTLETDERIQQLNHRPQIRFATLAK